MTSKEEYIVVLCTFPEPEVAESIAGEAIADRLAACVQMVPSNTIYRYQGEIHYERELLVFFKTRREVFPKLEAFLHQQHPFDIPEVIALPIIEGHPPYLQWIQNETSTAPGPDPTPAPKKPGAKRRTAKKPAAKRAPKKS